MMRKIALAVVLMIASVGCKVTAVDAPLSIELTGKEHDAAFSLWERRQQAELDLQAARNKYSATINDLDLERNKLCLALGKAHSVHGTYTLDEYAAKLERVK